MVISSARARWHASRAWLATWGLTPVMAWPVLAAGALLVGTFQPWIAVPLITSANAWQLPLDLGWGSIGLISYGLLATLIALGLLARVALALRPERLGRLARWARPMRRSTLLGMAAAAWALPLLALWQYAVADLTPLAQWAAAENQYLLILKHLPYHFSAQHIPMQPFQIDVSSISARATLLYQLAGPGLYLCLLVGIVCGYGATTLRGQPAPATRRARGQWGWWLLGGLFALIVVGRAPLGLWFEHLGQDAATQGNYSAALQRFDLAARIAPSLVSLPSFHQERGLVLVHLGQPNDADAGIFQAAQDRAAGALDLAWREDQALQRQYGLRDAITQDSVTTLETLAERDSNNGLTHDQRIQLLRYPLDPLPDSGQILPQLALAQTQLQTLLTLQPENIYAHELHGFILLVNRDDAAAANDFQTIQGLTQDPNMQSLDITYLAFCRAGEGDLAGERILIQRAMELDHGYYNTIAREAASGLH